MVELKQKHVVEEYKNRFKHKIEVVYPKENVENMLKGWQEKTSKLQEWLDDFEKTKQQAIDDTIKRMDEMVEKRLKDIAEFESMSKEEQYNKLIEQFNKDKEEFLEFNKNLAEHKEEAIKNVEEELKKYKEKAETDVKQLLDATTLWSNPVKKSL